MWQKAIFKPLSQGTLLDDGQEIWIDMKPAETRTAIFIGKDSRQVATGVFYRMNMFNDEINEFMYIPAVEVQLLPVFSEVPAFMISYPGDFLLNRKDTAH